MRHHKHRPAGIIDQRVDIRARIAAGVALRGNNKIGGAHRRNAGQRAVAGEALQAAPFEREAGILDAPEEDGLQLVGALPVHVGRHLQELGIRKAGRRCVGHRKRLGMDADQMALETAGERNGAIKHALGVLLVLQNGNDGLETHGDPSIWRGVRSPGEAFDLACRETPRCLAWFRLEPFPGGIAPKGNCVKTRR
nr:hypothetical protein [Mesorhizobium sp. LNHC221B00]